MKLTPMEQLLRKAKLSAQARHARNCKKQGAKEALNKTWKSKFAGQQQHSEQRAGEEK